VNQNSFIKSKYTHIRKTALAIEKAKGITSQELSKFSSVEFEWFCAYLFVLRGYDILQIATFEEHAADGGIDVVVKKQGKIFIVQCKKQNSYESENGRLSVKPVRELAGVVMREQENYNHADGVLITCGDYSSVAVKEASNLRNLSLINLWDIKGDPKLVDILITEKIDVPLDLWLQIKTAFRYVRYHLQKLTFLKPTVSKTKRKKIKKFLKWTIFAFGISISSLIGLSLTIKWYVLPEIFSITRITEDQWFVYPEYLSIVFFSLVVFLYLPKIMKTRKFREVFKRFVIISSILLAVFFYYNSVQNKWYSVNKMESFLARTERAVNKLIY
jgi:hypothetical protein